MKPKFVVPTLTALALFTMTSLAQTPAPAAEPGAAATTPSAPPAPADGGAAAATPAPATPPAMPEATTNAAPVTPAAPPAAPPEAATNAAPAMPATPGEAATNAMPAAAATPAEAAPAAVAPVPEGTHPGAVMPLVVMDEVPLTDAIKNLARSAGLNYILDPKVNFGQIVEGKVIPQPSVSIRWENVTAEQALYALLSTYSLQLVEDPKSHINRVTVKDPAAPEPLLTRVLQLKYASPSNVVMAVQNTLTDKRSKVQPDVRTSQLVVLATEKEQVDVEKLVASLDLPTRQVLIEARLIEMSMNPQTKKGIDWTPTLQAQNVTYGNGFSSGSAVTTIPGTPSGTLPGGRTGSSPNSSVNTVINTILGQGGFGANTASGLTPNIGFLNADGVKIVLSFINQDAEAKVISAPRTVTLDNEPAKIEVTRASPIINVTAGTANTTGGSTINYTNLGVILNVTPRISANDLVNLKVEPEVSRIFDTVTRVVGTTAGAGGSSAPNVFQADEYDVRKIQTRVIIPSGNTLVLGGLVSDDVRDSTTKVPVFGDLPVLGAAFRSHSKARQQNNLVIFITPTIVKDDDYQPTTSDFLKTPVVDAVEGKWSVWDTAKPMDWSKPISEQTHPNANLNVAQ